MRNTLKIFNMIFNDTNNIFIVLCNPEITFDKKLAIPLLSPKSFIISSYLLLSLINFEYKKELILFCTCLFSSPLI